MITREEYMQDSANLHNEYYAQFVNPSITHIVLTGIGKDAILNSTDEHFNDIPLRKWDLLSDRIKYEISSKLLKEAGGIRSLSTYVCVAKQAARMFKQKAIQL